MNVVDGLAARVDRGVAGLLVALMAIAVGNVVWQVFSRFVLGAPSSFTDELARYLLVWIGLLGAGHAAGRRAHLALDLLPARLGPRGRARLGLATECVVFLFGALVLVVGGGGLVALTLSLGQRSAALGVPLGVVYAVLPATGLLLMLHSTRFGRDHLRVVRGGSPGAEEPAGG